MPGFISTPSTFVRRPRSPRLVAALIRLVLVAAAVFGHPWSAFGPTVDAAVNALGGPAQHGTTAGVAPSLLVPS